MPAHARAPATLKIRSEPPDESPIRNRGSTRPAASTGDRPSDDHRATADGPRQAPENTSATAGGRTTSAQRMPPAQALEAGEVPVGCHPFAAGLDRQRRKVRVGDKVPLASASRHSRSKICRGVALARRRLRSVAPTGRRQSRVPRRAAPAGQRRFGCVTTLTKPLNTMSDTPSGSASAAAATSHSR